MKYVLDTCTISELVRPQPNKSVVEWIQSQHEQDLYLSIVTIGELQRGVLRLAESQRRQQLQNWVNDQLLQRFSDRLLYLDEKTMLIWASIQSNAESQGKKMPLFDSLIAASTIQQNMTLVTRNVSDISISGVMWSNPWH